MNDFGRVLRIAARNRWSLFGVLTSSFIIALLWGANIGTLYPMVEVVFQGESIPEYAERRILETDEMVGELEGELLTIKEQLKTSSGNERQELSVRGMKRSRRNVMSISIRSITSADSNRGSMSTPPVDLIRRWY